MVRRYSADRVEVFEWGSCLATKSWGDGVVSCRSPTRVRCMNKIKASHSWTCEPDVMGSDNTMGCSDADGTVAALTPLGNQVLERKRTQDLSAF